MLLYVFSQKGGDQNSIGACVQVVEHSPALLIQSLMGFLQEGKARVTSDVLVTLCVVVVLRLTDEYLLELVLVNLLIAQADLH